MDNLGKKVGYLKGLMEGIDFSENPAYGKLFTAIADLLGDLSDRVETMDELLDDLNDYVESIDDDLSELEGELSEQDARMFDADDDDFEDDFEDDFDDGEDQLHVLGGAPIEEDAGEDDAAALAGSVCPECARMFFVGMDDPEDASYICPHCGKEITPTPLTPENAPIAKPVRKD